MSEGRKKTVPEILAEFREKYTVRDCGDCNFRKSCDHAFGSDECKARRESIELAFGIEDKAFSGLLDSIEEAWKADQERQRAEWEARTLRELCVAKEENRAEFLKERGDPAAMRNALLNCKTRFSAIAMQNAEWRTCAQNHLQEIDMALALPHRNCDRFTGFKAAWRAYTQECADIFKSHLNAVSFCVWLLDWAKGAAKKEGGAN